jgi:hypothetical protein
MRPTAGTMMIIEPFETVRNDRFAESSAWLSRYHSARHGASGAAVIALLRCTKGTRALRARMLRRLSR